MSLDDEDFLPYSGGYERLLPRQSKGHTTPREGKGMRRNHHLCRLSENCGAPRTARWKQPVAAVALLGTSLIGGSLAASGSYASYGVCRTDPTVVLSDGLTIEMYADINDSISDVRSVQYTLHVPIAVHATSITYDRYGSIEHVSIVADQPSGHGYSDTLVTTGAKSVPVKVYASIKGWKSVTVQGVSGEVLRLSV